MKESGITKCEELTLKERRKLKREKFTKEHPKMADFLVKTELVVSVLSVLAIPYFFGRSSKFEQVKAESRMEGYLSASNDIKNELERAERDYIDADGKYHQDLKFGAYTVWKDKETYLNAEKVRLDSLSDDPFLE